MLPVLLVYLENHIERSKRWRGARGRGYKKEFKWPLYVMNVLMMDCN